ncbi:MAG: HAD family phosphatase [Acidimicrobiales bacterium]|jgi:HAD superfamily hydrolase (TIGR01509 family)
MPATAAHGRAFDALVFDLDGVIVDTERVIHETWVTIFARYGCSFTPEEWATAVGTADRGFNPFEELVARASVPLPSPAELREEVDRLEMELLEGLSPLPGIREWIEGAETLGMGVAVASSSPAPWVEGRLADVGLERHFVVVSCRNERLAAKPAPDLYLDACRRLLVDPKRAIAVEDSANGLAAARAAGLAAVAVPNSMTLDHDLSAADLVVESLAAMSLGEAVRRLAEQRTRD